MFKNFSLKKFIISFIILTPLLLIIDILYDKIFKLLIWKDIFAADNLFFKILTAIVLAYFYATIHQQKKND